MGNLAGIDIAIIVLYLIGVTVFGTLFGRSQKTQKDYFQGGRKLKWWAVGMSMVVTDIGVVEIVGVSGGAFLFGLSMASFDWIGCILAMTLAAFIFIPFYWRSGIYSIPEYLGKRYNEFVRAIVAIVWGSILVLMIGVVLWVSATTLKILLFWPAWVSILLMALFIGVYTFSGGLAAVVYTDAIQCVFLIVGCAAITIVGMVKVGGIEGLMTTVANTEPIRENFFHLILPADTAYPSAWSAVLFGLAFVLGPGYWIGHQAIVQRNLGTGSERDAKKSVLFGALIKTVIPFIIVVPGLIGFALFPDLESGDDVFPTLVRETLPTGLSGLFFAGMLAALMSTVSSYLNSGSTLWTMDIYRKFINRDATEEQMLKVGRILTVVFIVGAAAFSPVVAKFPGIFMFLITVLCVVQPGIFVLLLLGITWKRATAAGAISGLATGVVTSLVLIWLKEGLFIAPDPALYIAWWSFVASLVVTVAVSLATPAPSEEKLRNLVFSSKGSQ
jgi:SSS family solute:Na+ symporter